MSADRCALLYLRTRSPSCTGILYWPFNKGGPMMNYGSIDYSQRPLMPYYQCVRLFKPTLIHAYRDSSDIRVRSTNDFNPFSATLTIQAFDTTTSEIFFQEDKLVDVPQKSSHTLYTNFTLYDSLTNRWKTAVYVKISDANTLYAEDFLLFCPLFELETQEPSFTLASQKTAPDQWDLTITSNRFVKLLELESSIRLMFSDNYFMLLPGSPKTLHLTALDDFTAPPAITPRALDHKPGPTFTLD
jgi:beta-mannosidase